MKRIDVRKYKSIVVLTGAGISVASGDCDLFIAIGTSGSVEPASNFVRLADYAGARTILVNLEPMKPKNPYFRKEFLGAAEELLPQLL
jgi:NAD-dependent deacetylase